MRFRDSIGATVLAAVLLTATIGGAAAADETKYPDLKGQWRRTGTGGLLAGGAGGLRYDESKPPKPTLSMPGRSGFESSIRSTTLKSSVLRITTLSRN